MSKTFRNNLIGQQFGRWTVIDFFPCDKTEAFWLCRCSCEDRTEKVVNGPSLKKGRSQSCGCLNREISSELNSLDLLGQTFNRLTVIEKTNKRDGRHVIWKCQCCCGKVKDIRGASLTTGEIQSCGCLYINDLLHQTFGKLTVIEQTDKRTNDGKVIWKCQCSCENKTIIEVVGSQLTAGAVCSCGCQKSIGENNITIVLNQNNISFKKSYSFDDLKSNRNYKLFFDFAIFKNDILQYIIEFDGIQHDENTFNLSEEDYNNYMNNDKLKNKYCIKNEIPLIRIPFYERDNISVEMLKLETSPYLCCKEKKEIKL